ncbi:MAG: hypothetical protein JO002_00890 [Burkholderiaceae bacterium]|nr:hypothetical protein [Burkholderiaceae bacterium]
MQTTKILRPWLAALALCASANVLAYQPHAEAHVAMRPPPMRVEHVPTARAGYVWGHGYWGWRGGTHVWVGGAWYPERSGYRYVDARWVFVDGGWAFYPAYWDPLPVAPVVVSVQEAPVTYIERPQSERPQSEQPQQSAAPDGMDPNYWYYCHNPAGYFPYVKECGESWQQVTPQPPTQ